MGRCQPGARQAGVDGLDGKPRFHELGEVLLGEHRRNPVALERDAANHSGVFEPGKSLAHRRGGNIELPGGSVDTHRGAGFEPPVDQRGKKLFIDVVGEDLAADGSARVVALGATPGGS